MKKETRGRKTDPQIEEDIQYLRQYILDVGKASLKDICKELYKSTSLKAKKRARYIILSLRRRSKQENIMFYAVNNEHQFINEESFIECSIENKDRWAGYTKSIQHLIYSGMSKHPQLRLELTQLLGEMHLSLLESNTPKQ